MPTNDDAISRISDFRHNFLAVGADRQKQLDDITTEIATLVKDDITEDHRNKITSIFNEIQVSITANTDVANREAEQLKMDNIKADLLAKGVNVDAVVLQQQATPTAAASADDDELKVTTDGGVQLKFDPHYKDLFGTDAQGHRKTIVDTLLAIWDDYRFQPVKNYFARINMVTALAIKIDGIPGIYTGLDARIAAKEKELAKSGNNAQMRADLEELCDRRAKISKGYNTEFLEKEVIRLGKLPADAATDAKIADYKEQIRINRTEGHNSLGDARKAARGDHDFVRDSGLGDTLHKRHESKINNGVTGDYSTVKYFARRNCQDPLQAENAAKLTLLRGTEDILLQRYAALRVREQSVNRILGSSNMLNPPLKRSTDAELLRDNGNSFKRKEAAITARERAVRQQEKGLNVTRAAAVSPAALAARRAAGLSPATRAAAPVVAAPVAPGAPPPITRAPAVEATSASRAAEAATEIRAAFATRATALSSKGATITADRELPLRGGLTGKIGRMFTPLRKSAATTARTLPERAPAPQTGIGITVEEPARRASLDV